VERRKEPRFDCRQPATLHCLSGSHAACAGILMNISGKGARMVVDRPFPINMPVRIDAGDMLLLAEICYCRPESGGFSLGLALSHSLLEMTALGNIMRQLVDTPAAQPADAPIQTK
jgi:hypothetical protein